MQRNCTGRNVPRSGASSGSFGPQQDTSLEPPPVAELVGRCWHQSYAAFQPQTQGTVTMCMVLTAGAEIGVRSPRSSWQHSFFPPTPTCVLSARLFVISKRKAPVGIPTTTADLEGDPARDVGERPSLPSLPCLSQPASIKDNVGVSSCVSLATSSREKALLWEQDIGADRRWPLQAPRRTGMWCCLPF